MSADASMHLSQMYERTDQVLIRRCTDRRAFSTWSADAQGARATHACHVIRHWFVLGRRAIVVDPALMSSIATGKW